MSVWHLRPDSGANTHTRNRRTYPHEWRKKKKWKKNNYTFFRRLIRRKMWENKNFNCNCFYSTSGARHTIFAAANLLCKSAFKFLFYIFCVFLLVDSSLHHEILRKVKKKEKRKKSQEEETTEWYVHVFGLIVNCNAYVRLTHRTKSDGRRGMKKKTVDCFPSFY